MGVVRWTKEHDEFLAARISKLLPSAIAIELNEKFGTAYTTGAVYCRSKTLGIRPEKSVSRALVSKWVDYDDELVSLSRCGASCSQIAALINEKHGTSFTRSSVIGRLHRLGVNEKARDPAYRTAKIARLAPVRKSERTTVAVGPQIQAINRMRQKRAPSSSIEETFTPRTAEVPSRHVSILELKAMECRWPDEGGDPKKGIPHTFCGCRTADGSSYCAAHKALAWGNGTASERAAIRNAKYVAGASA
ncbi:GcrA family cell cycle regulator [Afipia carboxidovorans]|uniref:GcrA family cell cycle regulator n=1 Tax=Afipia carboxidovorans TaxID=40137 RepID=UPI00308AD98D|nr:hypothetical protein CRBSH125_01310 [Afipia carboxidovorans]